MILLIGAHKNARKEFDEALRLIKGKSYDVMAIGISSLKHLEGVNVKYFATYHIDDLDEIEINFQVISHIQDDKKRVNIIKPFDSKKDKSGSSALLGALAAIDLGYEKIILCGCPLEGNDQQGRPYSVFKKGWIKHLKEVSPVVRSMSGWTKMILGEPKEGWINEIQT